MITLGAPLKDSYPYSVTVFYDDNQLRLMQVPVQLGLGHRLSGKTVAKAAVLENAPYGVPVKNNTISKLAASTQVTDPYGK